MTLGQSHDPELLMYFGAIFPRSTRIRLGQDGYDDDGDDDD